MTHLWLLLFVLAFSSANKYHFSVCSSGKFPTNITIQSMSWLQDGKLLLLVQEYFLICQFECDTKIFVVDVMNNYKFGVHNFEARLYKGFFFINFKDQLLLNVIDSQEKITFYNSSAEIPTQETFENYKLLFNNDSNGAFFYNYKNNPNEFYVWFDRFSMENSDFNSQEFYGRIYSPFWLIHASEKKNEKFFSHLRGNKSQLLFNQLPSGCIFKDSIFMIDHMNSLVYQFNTTELFKSLQHATDFYAEHKTYKMNEFISCEPTCPLWLQYLYFILAFVAVLLICGIFAITRCCKKRRPERKKPDYCVSTKSLHNRSSYETKTKKTKTASSTPSTISGIFS